MTYWVLKAVLTPVLRFFYRVRVDGIEQVPPNGPVILASNHRSFSDSVFLPLVLRRRLTFVANAEYFEDRRQAWFLRAIGQLPVERGGGPARRRAMEMGRQVLAAGGMFGIYPEGARSPDGRLYRGHTGVARLALDTGAPVLAVAMIGTAETQPLGRIRPRPFMPVTVRFSRPLTFDRYGDRSDPRILRRITDEIMFELCELSGQEYASEYAPGCDPVEALAPEPAGVASAPPIEPFVGFEPFVTD